MAFKVDEVFARFLTMGALGTRAVQQDLNRFGHETVELERYSMGNKIWSVKVKRLRVPDLLCIACGRRFESKAKSKLEIKLSNSATVGREWFAGGMRPNDVFAFVRVVPHSDPPQIGPPLYLSRAALEAAVGSLKEGTRKALSEGAEIDVTWPSWVPTYGGTVIGWEEGQTKLAVRNQAGHLKRFPVSKWNVPAYEYLAPGEPFDAGSAALAGVVEPADVACIGGWDWVADLSSSDKDDRFAAAKSFRYRDGREGRDALAAVAKDPDEDWRVKLEAIGSLATHAPTEWLSAIEVVAEDVELPVERQIEAVFLLTEIPVEDAASILRSVAEPREGREAEVRSAAVWGLGLGAATSPELAAELLDDLEDRVALHAAATLPRDLPPAIRDSLRRWLISGTQRQAAVAATALARHGELQILASLVRTESEISDHGRLYAIRALGDLPRATVEAELGALIDDSVRERLDPIWIQEQDWLKRETNIGALDVLAAQQVR